MNDFATLEKGIVRELSCRLCLCTDIMRLRPLSVELKRKIKRLFDIVVRTDDHLPKAICHDCLQEVNSMYLYAVKVDKTQKFLDFHKLKNKNKESDNKSVTSNAPITNVTNEIQRTLEPEKKVQNSKLKSPNNVQIVDNKSTAKKSPEDMKFLESMPLSEFAETEKLDKTVLESGATAAKPIQKELGKLKNEKTTENITKEELDPIVLINGRPARTGSALEKQITLFYKMECCICHESGFRFKQLMRHYKDRHGVPGYVTCCNKKMHYFYPRKIIEHMAYHLQPNIFQCKSCHYNFTSSQELADHKQNGGHTNGKILCPRCTDKFPTYRELGWHLTTHRTDKFQCDYCAKLLKHQHRKRNINNMEELILCSQCIRNLKTIEKQEKEINEKLKMRANDIAMIKHHTFKQALGMSGDEDGSSD